MKITFFPKFPVSLAVLWIAAGSLSFAAPPGLPTTSIDVNSLPGIEPHGETSVTLIPHLRFMRRGCAFSSESDSWTCDGSVPPVSEMVDQMRRKGAVGKKVSAFYTELRGESGIGLSKRWMNAHTDLIPCDPGYVMFDEIVDGKWDRAVAKAMTLSAGQSRIVSYQKLISQVMAEQSRGKAWIFAPAATDFNTMKDDNTWAHWEFPALTQNPNIIEVIRTDPRDESNPPSLTTIWRQGDPTQVPRGLV